jgi:hypothetical protein
MRINFTKGDRLLQTHDVNTADPAQARKVAQEMLTQLAQKADGWTIVNDLDQPIMSSRSPPVI